MRKELLCSNAANTAIKGLSEALKRHGVIEGADVYYYDDDLKYPFFKLPQKVKKEQSNDSEVRYAFVDVNGSNIKSVDYRVCGSHTHEHLRDADAVAELVAKLLSGAVIEGGIVHGDTAIYFFMQDMGTPEDNFAVIDKYKPIIDEHLFENKWGERHTHADLDADYPYRLYCGMSNDIQDGCYSFMLTGKLGEQPTIKPISYD